MSSVHRRNFWGSAALSARLDHCFRLFSRRPASVHWDGISDGISLLVDGLGGSIMLGHIFLSTR